MTLHLLADLELGRVLLRHIGQHPHGRGVGDDIDGRRIAGLHEQAWRGVPGRDQPGDRRWHDERRVDLAVRDDLVDLGIGLAEHFDRRARRPVGAFGGLLVGNRLLVILLGGGILLVRDSSAAPGSSW